MRRRETLSAIGAAVCVGLAGCIDGDQNGDGQNSADHNKDYQNGNDDESGPEFVTGIVYEGTLSNFRDWIVDVVKGQTVIVKASEIEEGERLHFQVGDGTAFVHSYHFYEKDDGETNEYEIETDGQHELQLNPERHEVPVDKDVEISVSMELTKS